MTQTQINEIRERHNEIDNEFIRNGRLKRTLCFDEANYVSSVYVQDFSALLAALDEADKENNQWNDTDCDTCPLGGMECCYESCSSKLSLITALHQTIIERDVLEREVGALRDEQTEKIKELKNRIDMLFKDNAELISDNLSLRSKLEREYEKSTALKERLDNAVELPCKLGDTVYVIRQNETIFSFRIFKDSFFRLFHEAEKALNDKN